MWWADDEKFAVALQLYSEFMSLPPSRFIGNMPCDTMWWTGKVNLIYYIFICFIKHFPENLISETSCWALRMKHPLPIRCELKLGIYSGPNRQRRLHGGHGKDKPSNYYSCSWWSWGHRYCVVGCTCTFFFLFGKQTISFFFHRLKQFGLLRILKGSVTQAPLFIDT